MTTIDRAELDDVLHVIIIKFEHLIDTTEEYGTLDAIDATPA